MAKSRKKPGRQTGLKRRGTKQALEPKRAEGPLRDVTSAGPVPKAEIPPVSANPLGSEVANPGDNHGFIQLNLTDCEAQITFVSPGMARYVLVEVERVDPFIAEQLTNGLPLLVPTLIVRGERGRLLVATPLLRRVRTVSMYSGDTHSALMGMIYGLPRIILAEFENGAAGEAAAEELAELFDAWEGNILILLVAEVRGKDRHAPLSDGQVVAAHEVKLERPVLWHLGER